ncbi:hypothetical protein MKX03_013957 [Papaver bracteatum]|nr:hypothetical protein MKX03_013957 [Papaver bracteatum]
MNLIGVRRMAGANSVQEDQIVPFATTSREAKTLVLLGRVGNGKSAVGNSIIGRNVFLSTIRASGVTTTCKQETTKLDDGEIVNVIDTPGLFEFSSGTETLADEMFKCITLAKDGIDGFIFVCSTRTRFSTEEEGALQLLRKIYGEKIYNYMIIVFTGGDELETTFREYLDDCPPSLQRILHLCNDRVILFDNKTKEQTQRKSQVQQLMLHIKRVSDDNNGQSYTSEVFEAIKVFFGKNTTTSVSGSYLWPSQSQTHKLLNPLKNSARPSNSKHHVKQRKKNFNGN